MRDLCVRASRRAGERAIGSRQNERNPNAIAGKTAPHAIEIVRDALGRRLASRRASTDARPAAHAMRVFGGRPRRALRPQPRSATSA
ncbi:hypothetical protein WS71_06090 [Burkholderia mayonis]|uniref:Uncharacterized protein n=1 Tax=Burkholderia mayonis TaxID=1385591 RepID=A0A1B4FTC3_9BURK|nr:hypothetical protein WS71_06090 [Burkholderia mayonis]KVE58996.1 hypothetical protein WS71_01015 [Burkholderia mayonis]